MSLDGLLAQLEARHGSTRSLAAGFRQEKRFSFMKKPIISEGFIIFAAPDKIRFDITKPFQTALLDEGRKVQRYEVIDGQWRPLQFGGGKSVKLVMGQIGQWMQGKFSGQEEIFALSMSAGDPNDHAVLNLEPHHKQFRQYIEKIQVHIAPAPTYRVTRIDIHEPQGDSFSLIFSGEQKNKRLPEGCFSDPKTAAQCIDLFKHSGESKNKSEGKDDAKCPAGG
ncbi:MAG: outer membrane lipoprotein carrier protein LolA [Planctomycetota bacterium]